jgi:hypothetical protein
MKNVANLILASIIALAIFSPATLEDIQFSVPKFDLSFLGSSKSNIEVPKPANLYGFDVSLPKILPNRDLAYKLTGLFAGLADELERDGKRQKPLIVYVSHIRDTLKEAINIEFDSKKLNEIVPEFGSKIGPEFEKAFPDGSAPLDANLRAKGVELFRAVAYACSLK